MSKLPFKKYIQSLSPYSPGKPIDEVKRELGLDEIIKLASNENTLGPSPKAISAMQDSAKEMSLYPDGACFKLLNKLSEQLGLPVEQIIVGNGSNEIIEFIVKGFLSEDGEVLSSEYAFAVYPILTQAYGGGYKAVPMKDYTFDLEGIKNAISEKTKIIFIANPNNPTGTMVSETQLDEFISEVPENIVVCLDEAYYEFVEPSKKINTEKYLDRPNVIILRTFSKIYGLSGLRIGYGISSPEVIAYFNQIRQPFNVNAMAQAAGVAALDDTKHIEKTCQITNEGKAYLYTELSGLGLEYVESDTNFIMVKVESADSVFDALLKKGVIVRSLTSYGLDEYIRVTVGDQGQNKTFVEALKQVVS